MDNSEPVCILSGKEEPESMKKKMFYIRDCLIILIMTAAVLLDTFVVSQKYTVAAERDSSHETAAPVSAPVITGTSYQDENISVSISTYRYNDTDIYVADVQISDLSCLYSVLADNT